MIRADLCPLIMLLFAPMDISGLIVVLVLITLLVSAIVMLIVAFVISVILKKRISQLAARIDRLESIPAPQKTPHLLNPAHHDWMGAFALVLARLYAIAAKVLLQQITTTRREVLLLIAIALTLLSVVISIQPQSNWITITWAVAGLANLWAALKIRSVRLCSNAFALLGLAFFKLLLWDSPHGLRPAFIPVLNCYFLSSMAVIGSFLGAIYLFERTRGRKLVESQVPRLVMGLTAAFAFWFVISVETHTYFISRAFAERLPEEVAHQRWLGQMALSLVWAAYAGALAVLGFVRHAALFRWVALVLFAVTVLKATFVDIAKLEQFYRIIVFFVLEVILLLVARAYHKAFHSRKSAT